MSRAAGLSPVSATIAVLAAAIAAAVAGLSGVVLFASAMVASRILSTVLIAVLSGIDARPIDTGVGRRERVEVKLTTDADAVSDARIREWDRAWRRVLEHLEHQRREQSPAG